MQEGDLILVTWRDIQGSEGWKSFDNFILTKSPIIRTPCIYINEDENCLRAANDLADDKDIIGTIFPKGCILEIQELEIKQ